MAAPGSDRSFDRCYLRIFFDPLLKGENPEIKANALLLQNRFLPLRYLKPMSKSYIEPENLILLGEFL